MEIKNKSADVQIKNGKGIFSKDLLNIEVEQEDGSKIKLVDLFNDMLLKEAEMEQHLNKLDNELKQYKDFEAKIDSVFAHSLDLLQKKVARIEFLMEDK